MPPRWTTIGIRVAAMTVLVVDAGTRAAGTSLPHAWRLAHGAVVLAALAVIAHALWPLVTGAARNGHGERQPRPDRDSG